MSLSAEGYRKFYRDKSTSLTVGTSTDDQASFIAPKSTDHQIWVQRVTISPTTYAAKSWSIEDSNGTAKVIALASIPATAPTTGGDASFVFDFGAKGVPLTVGKGLTLNVSATGAAGIVTVLAYEMLANVVAAASTN